MNDSACARMAPCHIQAHLLSLTRGFNAVHDPADIRRQVRPILLVLQAMSHSRVFSVPVDPVALGIPEYPSIVKRPMDLGTVARNLESKGVSLCHYIHHCCKSWVCLCGVEIEGRSVCICC